MSEPGSGDELTLDQRRARHALCALDAVLKKLQDGATRKLYRSYVERLGPAVLVNGLGQALASELAASSSGSRGAHQLLAEKVASWLCDAQDGVFRVPEQEVSAMAVLERLCAAPQASYVRAQAEALAWLGWHKRFARARIEGDEAEPAD
jgi:CRISPR-associated protein Cmr5